MKSYTSTIHYIAELAPSLDYPGKFIAWAEDICALISHIYELDYEEVTEHIYDAVKQAQNYDDEE